jgi:hypothetical protein
MEEIYKVKAWDNGRSYIVFCPFCGRYHTHGRYEGHALSHCVKRPPWHPSAFDYSLVLVGPATPGMLRDMQRRRPKGPPWCL